MEKKEMLRNLILMAIAFFRTFFYIVTIAPLYSRKNSGICSQSVPAILKIVKIQSATLCQSRILKMLLEMSLEGHILSRRYKQ